MSKHLKQEINKKINNEKKYILSLDFNSLDKALDVTNQTKNI